MSFSEMSINNGASEDYYLFDMISGKSNGWSIQLIIRIVGSRHVFQYSRLQMSGITSVYINSSPRLSLNQIGRLTLSQSGLTDTDISLLAIWLEPADVAFFGLTKGSNKRGMDPAAQDNLDTVRIFKTIYRIWSEL